MTVDGFVLISVSPHKLSILYFLEPVLHMMLFVLCFLEPISDELFLALYFLATIRVIDTAI